MHSSQSEWYRANHGAALDDGIAADCRPGASWATFNRDFHRQRTDADAVRRNVVEQASEGENMSLEDDLGPEAENSVASDESGAVNRRKAMQRIGLAGGVAGAAWAAPSVIGVFDSPAGAAAQASALLCDNPSTGLVTVPANRVLYFDLGGGGGGGGARGSSIPADSQPGGNGGSGAQITGSIAAMASYTLTTDVGMGATWNLAQDFWGDGGTGYRDGEHGGDNATGMNTRSGSGGGGGGSSAITAPGISIVAAGGGGGAGGGSYRGDPGGGGVGGSGDTDGSPASSTLMNQGLGGRSGSNMGTGGSTVNVNGTAGDMGGNGSGGTGGVGGDGGDVTDRSGGGGGGGGGGAISGGGGGAGGGGNNSETGGGGGGGGGGDNATTGATSPSITPNGGAFGAGATARTSKGAVGGQGWVRLYLNMAGNDIANERCIYNG